MQIGDKITKTQTIRALKNGQHVGAIASKLNPHAFNNAFVMILDKNDKLDSNWVNSFKWYNCNKECGTGISFYLLSEV